MSSRVSKQMIQPINFIFRLFQQKTRVQIWLFEQLDMRIEGIIMGFDEYMNVVLDEAVEIYTKKEQRNSIGRIMLRGENITLIMAAESRS